MIALIQQSYTKLTLQSQFKLLMGLLLVVAALLRINLALHPGLWVDEIFSLAMATGHSLEHPADEANPALGDYAESKDPQPASIIRRYMEHDSPPAGFGRVIRAVQLSDTSPPLYYLALNLWTRIVGTSDAALRLFSTLFAIACFPLVWSLGLQLGDKKTACAACLLFTASPLAIYYSAEGRMYSLLWFFALLLTWSSLALYKRGPRPHLLSLWVVSAAAGLLTHYFFAFVVATCTGWMLLHFKRVHHVHVAGLLAATTLILLPWYHQLPSTLARWRVTGHWLEHPIAWKEAFTNPVNLFWSYYSPSGVWGGSRRGNTIALGICACVLLLSVFKMKRLLSKESQIVLFVAMASCLGPVVLDLLQGTNTSSIGRYALPGLPSAILALAYAASLQSPIVLTAFLILLSIAWFPVTRKMFIEPARYWEPFPEASSRLSAWGQPEDLIIVHSIPSGVLGVARYLQSSTPIISWVVQLKGWRIPDDLARLAHSRRRIALAKIHDLNEPSPAETWLSENRSLQSKDTLFVYRETKYEILYFEKNSQ